MSSDINYQICKIIFNGIHRAKLFNKFEIMSLVLLSADLVKALTSCELNTLLNSWKHKTRSLYKRRHSKHLAISNGHCSSVSTCHVNVL